MKPSPSPNQQVIEGGRIATILVVRVKGLSLLADCLEVEAARSLVKQTWGQIDWLIRENEGFVAAHLGDMAISLWGRAAAGGNAADKAIKAALALRDNFSIPQLEGQPGIEQISLVMGVHTGTLLNVPLKHENDLNLIGDALTTTLQLAQTGKAGMIVISENTERLVHGVYKTAELPPIALVDYPQPLRVFRLDDVQEGSGRARYRSINPMQTLLAGRSAEIAELQQIYQQSVRLERPTLVVVTGEAGIGKSRLLMEFSGSLEAETSSFYLMSSRALAQTVRVPFYIWKMIFNNRFGITSEDSLHTASEKFLREFQRAWGRQLGPAPAIEAAHMVGSMVGLDWLTSPYLARYIQDPLGRVNRAYELMRELLRRISGSRPTLLMMDDIHWADEDSLDLLLYLLEADVVDNEPTPLMILTAANPEFLDQRPNLAKHARIIELQRLPSKAEIVAEAYPNLASFPDSILGSLAQMSDGNPYFLEELVRRIITSDQSSSEDALYETLARYKAQPASSLEALLRTRLEDLTRIGRATALLASISGRVFWVGAIEAAVRAFVGQRTDLHLTLPSALAEQSIEEGLRQLVTAELAFPRADSTYSSEQEYIFKHDLLREVAYKMIPAGFRAPYHLAVGRWMVSRGEPEYLIQAADQFEMAGAYTEAQAACAQAAQMYQSRGAMGESQMLLERSRMIRDRAGSERTKMTG
jgi:class 3 adenylate cyclase/energy-coupling factor transporter ATP-binding protein EcfA2